MHLLGRKPAEQEEEAQLATVDEQEDAACSEEDEKASSPQIPQRGQRLALQHAVIVKFYMLHCHLFEVAITACCCLSMMRAPWQSLAISSHILAEPASAQRHKESSLPKNGCAVLFTGWLMLEG